MQIASLKINRFNIFLSKKERVVFRFIVTSIILMLAFYIFLLFSTVSFAYSIDNNKEIVNTILGSNSSLDSNFLIKKGEMSKNLIVDNFVNVNKIIYIDSSLNGVAFNKEY